jgi:lipopolysaccharide biosynthesis glycosyltransferase
MSDGSAAISLALASDESFAIPLAVTVRSIIASHTAPNPLEFFILDLGIAPDTRRRLECSWAAPGVSLQFIRADAAHLEHLPVWGRMRFGTYMRLLMGRLLPAPLERVIWLDSDLVVERDITALWEAPLNGRVLAAVQDLVVPFVSSRFGVEDFAEHGMRPDAPHFNAGVMLVDLQQWRATDVAQQAIDYLDRRRGRVWFWDQQALNVVLRDRWTLLDPRWNVIASVTGKSLFHAGHLNPAEYQQCIDDPWIVHWAGSIKPWAFDGCGPLHERWRQVLDQTDFAGWRPPATARNAALRFYDTRLRRLTYPLEQWPLRLQRFLGQRK